MSGRYKTVALQAVGVAVFAAIVFVAFLRPTDPGDLSGIEAEGGNDPIVVDPTPPDENKKRKRGGSSRSGAGPNRGAPAGPGGQGADGGTTPGGAASDTNTPLDGSGDSPPVDQYDDTVARLMDQVGRPALFREIDPGP